MFGITEAGPAIGCSPNRIRAAEEDGRLSPSAGAEYRSPPWLRDRKYSRYARGLGRVSSERAEGPCVQNFKGGVGKFDHHAPGALLGDPGLSVIIGVAEVEISAVVLRNLASDIQAESTALLLRTGAKKGLEHYFAAFLRDSRTVIGDRDPAVAGVHGHHGIADEFIVLPRKPGLSLLSVTLGHPKERVCQEILKNLHEHALDRSNDESGASRPDHDADTDAGGAVSRGEAVDDVIDPANQLK